MKSIFFILTLITMALIVIVLITGIALMAKGGELNKKYSNKLMKARVYLQGLALVFFFLSVTLSE